MSTKSKQAFGGNELSDWKVCMIYYIDGALSYIRNWFSFYFGFINIGEKGTYRQRGSSFGQIIFWNHNGYPI